MKLFWIIFLSIIVFANGYSKIIQEGIEKEYEDAVQILPDDLEASPFPIQFIFVLRTNSPNYEQQLQLYRFIYCSFPSLNNNKTLLTNLLLLSPSDSMKDPLYDFSQISCMLPISISTKELPAEDFMIESNTSLCSDFLKAVDHLFSNYSMNQWKTSAKNFILFNFNSNDSDSCEDKYEEYMAEKGLSTVGTFLNIIHVNSTIIPEQPHVNFKDDQRFFLGYQLIINSSNDLDHYQKYYTIFRYFTKQMIQSSINYTKNYFEYLSNDSFIHLNQKYVEENFEENSERKNSSDRIFNCIFIMFILISAIATLTIGILVSAADVLVSVLDSVNYQIEIIRTTNILNPQPTLRPAAATAAAAPVTSDPKLALQPILERSFSSVIWCDNLFTADESNSSRDTSEMELDETQSITSFESLERNISTETNNNLISNTFSNSTYGTPFIFNATALLSGFNFGGTTEQLSTNGIFQFGGSNSSNNLFNLPYTDAAQPFSSPAPSFPILGQQNVFMPVSGGGGPSSNIRKIILAKRQRQRKR